MSVKLLDGSAGSCLWQFADEAGIEKTSVWRYNIEYPELVKKLCKSYIAAGSSMIQTNTFSLNYASVKHEHVAYSVKDSVKAAAEIAREALAEEGREDIEIYLSSGPLTMLLEPYGDLTEEECLAAYDEIVSAAAEAGIKYVMFETFMDLEMMKLAVTAAKKYPVKISCSLTFEKRGKTLMGNSVPQIVEELEALGIDAIGLNCGLGPVEAMNIIEQYRENTKLPLYFKPNSGTSENYNALQFAKEIQPALEYVSYVGGCCGCDAEYIKEIGKLL